MLQAEQASLLMDQGLVLGMIRVMEQVLRSALTQAFERGTTAAASCSSAAGPAPPSVRAAAAAASDMLRKALAMEQQVGSTAGWGGWVVEHTCAVRYPVPPWGVTSTSLQQHLTTPS
jgi:hypothetical protein